MKALAILSGLVFFNCAAIIESARNEASNKVYFNGQVKKKDVHGGEVLILPLSAGDTRIASVENGEKFEKYKSDDEKTFNANREYIASPSAWSESFNAHYLPFAKKNIKNVKPLVFEAGEWKEGDYRSVPQTVENEPREFRILSPEALERKGLKPDFGLFVSRVEIHPVAGYFTGSQGLILNRKEITLTLVFEFALWDYRNDRMVSCGSFQERFDLSSVAPVTGIMAERFATKVFRLAKYLQEEPNNSGL